MSCNAHFIIDNLFFTFLLSVKTPSLSLCALFSHDAPSEHYMHALFAYDAVNKHYSHALFAHDAPRDHYLHALFAHDAPNEHYKKHIKKLFFTMHVSLLNSYFFACLLFSSKSLLCGMRTLTV